MIWPIQITQGLTKRCRLSWLTNSALVYKPKCGVGGCGLSANEYSCAHGAQINFGDLTPYPRNRRRNVDFTNKVKIIWLPWSLEANISRLFVHCTFFNVVLTCLKAPTMGRQVYCMLENMALCCLCLSTHLHSLGRGEPFRLLFIYVENVS